jgi:hypothetical protein
LTRGRSWGILLVSVVLAAGPVVVPGSDGRMGEDGLARLLPKGAQPGGWVRDGETQGFAGEDLFVYIDGGAEIYHEYGFSAVVVQDYRNPDGKSLSLEIFEMTDAAAAYGMYTFKNSGKGKPVDLGAGGQVEEYYLNYYKGRYLVTITGFDASPETVQGLTAVGAAVDLHTEASGPEPEPVGKLPRVPGFDALSVKYVRGRLGLNSLLPFLSGSSVPIREAVRAAYGRGELFVLRFPGEVEASKGMDVVQNVLRDSGGFRDYRETGGTVSAAGEKTGPVRVMRNKTCILVTTGLDAGASAQLISEASERL